MYRSEIDGLRAVAVISVVIYHFWPALAPGGYLGVDIFFVISGYVITASLSRDATSSLKLFLLNFYNRRIKRLMPALWLCVLVGGVIVVVFDATPKFSLRTGVAALFGVSNIYLQIQAADYFEQSAELNAFTQTWSLGVEEQYYVVFPVVFFLAARSGDALLRRVMIALSVLSLFVFIWLQMSKPMQAFYMMPARFWELGAGALVHLYADEWRKRLAGAREVASATMILALGAVVFFAAEARLAATIIAVGATAILIGSVDRSRYVKGALDLSFMNYLGRASYSIYLWHWIVLVAFRLTLGVNAYTFVPMIALTMGVAHLSYFYVEKPLRYADWAPTKGRTIIYGLSGSLAGAVLLLLFVGPLDGRLFAGRTVGTNDREARSLLTPYRVGDGPAWKGKPCVLSSNAEVGKEIRIEDCTLGDFARARKRVLVLGNSFSAAFVQAFDDAVAQDGVAVVITSSWGASAVPEMPNDSPWSLASKYYWSDVAPKLISHLRQGDVVLIVNDMASFSPPRFSDQTQASVNLLSAGLDRLSKSLGERGVKLALLHGLPFAREAKCRPEQAIRQWYAPFQTRCPMPDRATSLLRRAPLDQSLKALEGKGAVKVIDLFDPFCPTDKCSYEAPDGSVLYRDEWSHPSVAAARAVRPAFRGFLRE
jgi:peptidoglycan/LPS O-acetylase OafA/YrhL